MKIYNKKSDILENLGKDKKDTKYLDRAIERGEILEYGGYYVKRDELLADAMNILIVDNERYQLENNQLREKVENFSEANEELEEAKINVEYYKNEAEEANDKVVALESVLDNLRAKGLDIWFANE